MDINILLRNETSPLLILITAIALTGCSVAVNFYVQNSTNQAVSITLISHEDLNHRNFEFVHTDASIEKIKFNTFKQMKTKITSKDQGDGITISVPPKSILYIGPGTIFIQCLIRLLLVEIRLIWMKQVNSKLQANFLLSMQYGTILSNLIILEFLNMVLWTQLAIRQAGIYASPYLMNGY